MHSLKVLYICIVINVANTLSVALCPANFGGVCYCGNALYESNITFVTNCTDTELMDASILKYLPVDTKVLIFTGNKVSDLPVNIFGVSGGHIKLKVIDFSNNHIQTIKGRSFHDVASVRKLILNDNDIYLYGKDNHPRIFSNFEELEELQLKNSFTEKLSTSDYIENLKEMFVESELNNLRFLSLEKNELSTIGDKEFFCSLPLLKELKLGENHLTDFAFNVECLTQLTSLDLSYNNILYFNNDTLSAFDSLPHLKINLTGNPFRCDCNMIDMLHWFSTSQERLVSPQTYQCIDGFPSKNIGRFLSNITLSDLQCHLFVNNFQHHLSATYVILVLMIIICGVIFTGLIYRYRRTFRDVMYRMSNRIRRKFQYDSLDKPEEAEMEV